MSPEATFTTTTGSSNDSITRAVVPFRGTIVTMDDTDPDCDHASLGEMHHIGPDGKHYCPTGFVWCNGCGAFGVWPEGVESECKRWGE